ncbi:MAG: 6-phosphogluconolactonase, partial [Pseudomonadota bacterium]
ARIAVILNDERWVPESASRSNTRLLKTRLLRDRAAKATLIPLYAEAPTPEEKLDQLTAGLDGHLPISVLLLGVGTDMHTASLFPGADQLELALSNDAPPLLAMRASGAAEPRITLTAPVLMAAMNTHVLITGHAKRAAVEAAQHMTPQEAPIRAMLPNAKVHWAE